MHEKKRLGILGCGWLGRALTQHLPKQYFQISGTTTRPENLAKLEGLGITPYLLEVGPTGAAGDSTFFSINDVFLISIPPRRKTNGLESFLEQIQVIRELCRKASAKHVVMISSTSVYTHDGHANEETADQTSLLVRAENALLQENSFPTTVIRFAGLVGPDRHPGRFLSGKVTTGENDPVNLIHVQDCVAILEAVLHQEKQNEVFNACSEQHPSRKTFYEWACNDLGVPAPQFVPPASVSRKVVVSAKLKQHFGYTFRYPDPMAMKF